MNPENIHILSPTWHLRSYIPAVKITGKEEETTEDLPDPVLSNEAAEDLLKVLDPLDSSLFLKDHEEETTVPPLPETEFSDFLLDAVDWL